MALATAVEAVENGPGTITYTWQPPNFNGGAPITRYEYRYREDSKSWISGQTADGDTLSVTLEGLNPAATTYSFEVRARNSVGLGPELAIAGGDPTATAPTGVPTLTARYHAATDGSDVIELSWPKLGSDLDGDMTLDEYNVEWKDNGDKTSYQNLTSPPYAAELTENYSFDHSNDLAAGTTYTYRVRASNSIGDGDWSAEVSATTPQDPPGPLAVNTTSTNNGPILVAVDVDAISVSWEPPRGRRRITFDRL